MKVSFHLETTPIDICEKTPRLICGARQTNQRCYWRKAQTGYTRNIPRARPKARYGNVHEHKGGGITAELQPMSIIVAFIQYLNGVLNKSSFRQDSALVLSLHTIPSSRYIMYVQGIIFIFFELKSMFQRACYFWSGTARNPRCSQIEDEKHNVLKLRYIYFAPCGPRRERMRHCGDRHF